MLPSGSPCYLPAFNGLGPTRSSKEHQYNFHNHPYEHHNTSLATQTSTSGLLTAPLGPVSHNVNYGSHDMYSQAPGEENIQPTLSEPTATDCCCPSFQSAQFSTSINLAGMHNTPTHAHSNVNTPINLHSYSALTHVVLQSPSNCSTLTAHGLEMLFHNMHILYDPQHIGKFHKVSGTKTAVDETKVAVDELKPILEAAWLPSNQQKYLFRVLVKHYMIKPIVSYYD
ncbi:uncharacterized protein BXZ73DRAFT_81009 [Epithele typhae]|uniref:uncharacterized protein n=1 Tax=Epithele typhae TaxID=378194 RepID=UPI002008687A|nr:uncharacterized protein BXZ73DRAFT_81009 [Epithele typhae]KAH9916769.1 hypothetical protein BXZ73DRAFT_81009 [Epithele typhae]